MVDVDRIRKQFPIYKKYPNIRFFDSAASSLTHKDTIKLLTDYLKYNGTNVHRGVYQLAAHATDLYEQSRANVAKFLNASTHEIVFTKSTTHALNMLARSFEAYIQANDEIILSELEHHSNLLPWLELAYKKKAKIQFIPIEKGRITLENFKRVLNKKTKLVVTHHISNVLGFITPLKAMAKLAHKVGALMIVDAAQSVAHLTIDVKKLGVDFLTFSGHKMYGPNGIGVLFGKEAAFDLLRPAEFGGEMVDRVKLDGSTFKALPYNFEAGTPAIAEAIGLSGAIKFLKRTGLSKIHAHEVSLKNYVVSKLQGEKDIIIYNEAADSGIITFNIEGIHPHDTASFLDQYDVAVRAGHHCNQLTMKYLNVNATVRASFGVYNTLEDCDILISAILEARNFFKSF